MMLMASRQRVHGIQRAEGVSRGDFIAYLCNSIIKLYQPLATHGNSLTWGPSTKKKRKKKKDKISPQKRHTRQTDVVAYLTLISSGS